ncbi:MAG: NucA/NucB deoxyribonuclease domain-containing protein [Dermatophilaceae bacterium]
MAVVVALGWPLASPPASTAAAIDWSMPAPASAPPGAADDETGTIRAEVGVRRQVLDDLRSQARRSADEPAEPSGMRAEQAEQAEQRDPGVGSGGRGRSLSAADGAAQARSSAARQEAADQEAVDGRVRSPDGADSPVGGPAGGDAATALAPPVGEQPPGDLVEECFAAGAEGGIGRVLNRFAYCRRITLEVTYYEIDAKGNPVEEEGTTTAQLEVFAQGDETQRRVRTFSRIQEGSVDYDWGPIDNILVAPNVPLSLIGQCEQDFRVCGATRGPATLPWATWDNSSDWFYWDVLNRVEQSEGRDQISYNRWFVEAFTDDDEYKTLVPGRTPARLVRCDSAAYFSRGQARLPAACVHAEVTPRLTYRLGSNLQSVAFHVFTAQDFPNSTYPLLVPPGVPAPRDKRIPGEFVAGDANAPGLHRITARLHPGETLANRQHKDGACFKTGPLRDEYLDTGLPVPPGAGEQCDEYPFASTVEGAGNPFWDFSVKAVPQRDNSIAGNQLGRYYVDDRVLAWDAGLDDPEETNDEFYVNIE